MEKQRIREEEKRRDRNQSPWVGCCVVSVNPEERKKERKECTDQIVLLRFAPPFILPTVDSEISAKAKLAKLKGETIK